MQPLITLEEHYLSSAFNEDPRNAGMYSKFPPANLQKLRDLGSGRIADMDSGAVSLQVISHGPGRGNASQCRSANESLHAAVKSNPSRFAGFATLPMEEPERAAAELKHAVEQLGFVGALLENSIDGRFYDDESFWPVFEMAEKLDCVVYIHPTFPSKDRSPLYKGNYDVRTERALSAFVWGWHMEVGLHFLRLFAAGLFDKYPKLKIVIGHMGEFLPFQLERVAMFAGEEGEAYLGEGRRDLMDVWDNNIWITTSGMFALAPLACLLRNTKIERILYSVDYPFSRTEQGLKFLEDLKQSGLVTEEQLDLITHKNAEDLLKLKAR